YYAVRPRFVNRNSAAKKLPRAPGLPDHAPIPSRRPATNQRSTLQVVAGAAGAYHASKAFFPSAHVTEGIMQTYRVLLIEDSLAQTRLIEKQLASATGAAFVVETADRLETGLQRLAAGPCDAVLLDLTLPDSDGMATFTAVRQRAGEIPIVVLT